MTWNHHVLGNLYFKRKCVEKVSMSSDNLLDLWLLQNQSYPTLHGQVSGEILFYLKEIEVKDSNRFGPSLVLSIIGL